ncbi:hypothetical protein K270103H11_21510 [Gordonibacter urolithinfaciens]
MRGILPGKDMLLGVGAPAAGVGGAAGAAGEGFTDTMRSPTLRAWLRRALERPPVYHD